SSLFPYTTLFRSHLLPQIYQVKTELKKFCLKKSEVIDKSNSMSIMSFATTDLYPHSVQSKTGGWRLKKIASSSIAKWKQIFRASTQQETLIHKLEKSNYTQLSLAKDRLLLTMHNIIA